MTTNSVTSAGPGRAQEIDDVGRHLPPASDFILKHSLTASHSRQRSINLVHPSCRSRIRQPQTWSPSRDYHRVIIPCRLPLACFPPICPLPHHSYHRPWFHRPPLYPPFYPRQLCKHFRPRFPRQIILLHQPPWHRSRPHPLRA
jgi:hypothetical protein